MRNDPKRFNNKIRQLVAVKEGIYRQIKGEEERLRDRYNTMKRTVKAEIRKAKRNYEIKVAREVKENVKEFFSYTELNLGTA